MSESDTYQLVKKVEALWKSSTELLQSSLMIRGIGYGLLLLVLFDLIYLFIPPGFMNPAWEFQTFGAIIERIAVPLIALVLIFWGGQNGRFKFEIPLLKGLSWLSLVAGILLLLAIPLGIFNTLRLDRQANAQINSQIEQSRTQIRQLQEQVGNVTTEAQMQELIAQLNQSGSVPEIEGSQQLETVKEELASSLTQGETSLAAQAQNVQRNQRLNLLKNSVKWNLGSLVSSALFFWFWLLTRIKH
jgi:uncharacterized protein YneF (UPF0154 family)